MSLVPGRKSSIQISPDSYPVNTTIFKQSCALKIPVIPQAEGSMKKRARDQYADDNGREMGWV